MPAKLLLVFVECFSPRQRRLIQLDTLAKLTQALRRYGGTRPPITNNVMSSTNLLFLRVVMSEKWLPRELGSLVLVFTIAWQ